MFHGTSFAQSGKNYGCYTDEHNRQMELQNPQILKNNQAFEKYYEQVLKQAGSMYKTNAATIKIPVVVHIVTEKGLNGISKAQVLNGIQVLNRDFQRLNPDTVNTHLVFRTAPYNVGSNLGIEFVMARLDPSGQPTEGIDRVTSFTTNGPVTRDDVKKAAPAWDATKYFNVWLVQTINSEALSGGTILGYAQFPDNTNYNNYGLVMLHSQWGKLGEVPGSTATTDGRTATHEAGHCFNLYHTFQNGCSGPDHSQTGDRVGDTPPSSAATYNSNCNNTQNTCTTDTGAGSVFTTDVQDMTENYMSYDECQNMFTKLQRTRVLTALGFYPQLVNLTSTSNAVATGIDPSVTVGPLVPQPYFGVQSDRVCAGNSVTFTDASYNGNVTTWNWSFPGGTPSTSTAQNPTVTYNTPGVYDVILTAGNGTSSRTLTKTGFIRVGSTTNLDNVAIGKQFVEDFEDPNFPNNAVANKVWERFSNSLTAGTATWEQTGAAATTGSLSMRVRNSAAASGNGTVHTLISPTINVAGISGPNLYFSFDLAYAPNTSTPGEILDVYASNDCGQTWVRRYSKNGTALATNGGAIVSGNFIPNSNQWRKETTLISPNLMGGNLTFKIEATSRNGNNLYMDNFRVYTILGTNEDLAKTNGIKVYPNPITTETGIDFELKNSEKVSVKILDLVGNTVYNGAEVSMAPGKQHINLYEKMQGLKAGMYMVQLQLGESIFNTKLIAQ